MNDALFIDVSNLNVLFKYNGKFVLGISYLGCPEKLAIDAQALGNAYDVYLSMWPRPEGEGDVTIPDLAPGRVPFVALRDELQAIVNYVSKFPGANNIYLCNALANFTIPSRVGNFQSVIPCGHRYAFFEVRDKILDNLFFFASQREFFETMGEDFTCYGDGDIVDVDSLRAQYPELAEYKKNIIVPLVPLIVAYRSNYKVSLDVVRDILDGKIVEPPKPVKEEPKKEAPVPEPEEEAMPRPVKPSKQKMQLDLVSLGLGVVACIGMFIGGVGYSFRDIDATTTTQNLSTSVAQRTTEPLRMAQAIYDNGFNMASDAATLLSYAKSSDLGVSVTSLDAMADGIRLSFSCGSEEVKDSFISYLNANYTTETPHAGQPISNTDGTETLQYTVTVHP